MDYLVLATGSTALIPKVAGIDLTGVTPLHHPGHAQLIKAAVKGGAKKIVVIGAGLVGLETAAALTGKGREIISSGGGRISSCRVFWIGKIAELLRAEMIEGGVDVHFERGAAGD